MARAVAMAKNVPLTMSMEMAMAIMMVTVRMWLLWCISALLLWLGLRAISSGQSLPVAAKTKELPEENTRHKSSKLPSIAIMDL